jgi:hypothetical protein
MPDRAKIISQLASKGKEAKATNSKFTGMGSLSESEEKDVKAMGEILEPEGYGMMRKDKIKSIVEPLPTPKDKEAEVEDLLSESEMEMEKKAEYAAKEKANYDRIKKQGMSDQGIVSPEELVAAGKKVYRKVKSKVKSMME